MRQLASDSPLGLALSLQPPSGVVDQVSDANIFVFPGVPDPNGPHGSSERPTADHRGTLPGNTTVQQYINQHVTVNADGERNTAMEGSVVMLLTRLGPPLP